MTDQPSPGESALPPTPSPDSPGGPQPSAGQQAPPASSAPGGSYPPPPPPPGGGSYPPPPPSAGGYAPPPPGPAIRTLPTESYAPWLSRALAFVIDYLPYVVVQAIGSWIMFATQQSACVTDVTQYTVNQYCATQDSTTGVLAQWLATLIGLAYLVWNYGYRQGTTGSSLGKSVMKIKVVSEVTGAPIGFGMSVVRQIAHIVDAIICFIGFLMPLWDSKRQTLADKIMSTVVLPIEE
ncbi:RDD family protein [Mycobacterium palustre]|uniref:RDD family protein n=1 Tax=Mycobacterium palustre TaxID=153971 RepID=UPI0021F3C553|nr:RDD family protein [Mycobacterium palustre]MCV7102412.1 RDD family protein [Mycobacterium palustre]